MNKAVKESVSMEVTRIATELEKNGKKVYKLSIGDTHFDLPNKLKQNIVRSLETANTHYINSMGNEDLRSSISKYEFSDIYKSNEILITPGVKQGLYYFFKLFNKINVCILEPAWLGYHSICQMTGNTYFSIDVKSKKWIEQLDKSQFDVLILCSPNNPDGKIYSNSELKEIYKAVERNKAILVLDEIYNKFSYLNYVSDTSSFLYFKKNVVVFNGFSKAFAATGLRLGYIATHNIDLLKKINIINQNIATCSNSLIQHSFIKYNDSLSDVEYYKQYYKQNRDLIVNLFPELEEFIPQGGFYFFVDLRKFGIENAEEFCKKILLETGVALVPGSAYGENYISYVRLSFSISSELLKEGILVLKEYLMNYGN